MKGNREMFRPVGFSSGLKVTPRGCFCWLAKKHYYLFTRWQFADAHALQPGSDAFFRAENKFVVWAHGSWPQGQTQAIGISCGIWQWR